MGSEKICESLDEARTLFLKTRSFVDQDLRRNLKDLKSNLKKSFFFSGLLQYILCENQDVETRLRTIFSGLSIQNRNNYSFLLFSCCFFVA